MVNFRREKTENCAHNPRALGDLLDLVQFAVIWIAWLIIFVLHTHRSTPTTASNSITATVLYLIFLFISLIPLLLHFVLFDPMDIDRSWIMLLYIHLHTTRISALPSACCLFHIRRRTDDSTCDVLSIPGLARQCLVFSHLAATWPGRLVNDWYDVISHPGWDTLRWWF
ncbi:hypothetical protein QBC41DRAFT_321712 [Cercophora samala]|uniref:Uncharacterized protein n=1 Tax=Cercophora samala TaxID=330535 RepID=A0AA39ZCM9_9PEZI|nr:hypothetical protein QBC41DRAFT_321712 [Cercophora samala]